LLHESRLSPPGTPSPSRPQAPAGTDFEPFVDGFTGTPEEFTFPVASGIIAGGSLMGVGLMFWENGAEMIRRFLHH
jgi:hypothetical protein